MKKFLENASTSVQIELTKDRKLYNAFKAYQTSLESELLKGEEKRSLYPELIKFEELKETNEEAEMTVMDVQRRQQSRRKTVVSAEPDNDDSEDEDELLAKMANQKQNWFLNIPTEANSNFTKRLSDIALEALVNNFDGSIHKFIHGEYFEKFGQYLDVELPLKDVLNVYNEHYWKRVVDSKIHNRLDFEKYSRQEYTNWRQIGIELKFSEFIENLPAEKYDEEELLKFSENQKLISCIEKLSLRQILPRNKIEKNFYNPNYRVFHIFPDENHHGSLKFLGNFYKLKHLSLTFGKRNAGLSYEKRFFEISQMDVELLSSGLKKLQRLESFAIRNSRLNKKENVDLILTALKDKWQLKSMDFSFCSMEDDIGDCLKTFFETHQSLERLELQGNNLGSKACDGLGMGLSTFKGTLKYLGISGNPINEDGVLSLGAGIKANGGLEELNLSNCDVGPKGSKRIAQFLGFFEPLKSLNIGTIKFTQKYSDRFIRSLIRHYEIEYIDCRCCGFSDQNMLKVKVLLARNIYFKTNSILKRPIPWTKQEEEEAEEWLKSDKHPLFLKHQQIYKDEFEKMKKHFEDDKRSIIPNDNELKESHIISMFRPFDQNLS